GVHVVLKWPAGTADRWVHRSAAVLSGLGPDLAPQISRRRTASTTGDRPTQPRRISRERRGAQYDGVSGRIRRKGRRRVVPRARTSCENLVMASGVIAMRTWTLALIATLGFGLSGCGYNSLQQQDEQIKAAWSEVVNQYQRRADLIPNLVNTVKG